jgi:hypothetical protein
MDKHPKVIAQAKARNITNSYNSCNLFDEIKKINDKTEEIKNEYDSRFTTTIGCTLSVAKSVESLYIKIQDESKRQISELDAQFKDVREQTYSFFETLLTNIKNNNEAIERLKLSLPNNAFSAEIVDEITASIKSLKDENTKTKNALESLSDFMSDKKRPNIQAFNVLRKVWQMFGLEWISCKISGYLFEDIRKNEYNSLFTNTVGCTLSVAKSVESLYIKIQDESKRQISELDAQFKDVREQTYSFFETLLTNIKNNNEDIDKLELSLPNNAFSAEIVDEITASIKSRKDENTEIINALTSFMSSRVIPEEIIHRVQSSILKVKEPTGFDNLVILEGVGGVEGVEGVKGVEGFEYILYQSMSPYPDVFYTNFPMSRKK